MLSFKPAFCTGLELYKGSLPRARGPLGSLGLEHAREESEGGPLKVEDLKDSQILSQGLGRKMSP